MSGQHACIHVLWTLMSDSNIYLGRLKNPTKIRPGGLSWSILTTGCFASKAGWKSTLTLSMHLRLLAGCNTTGTELQSSWCCFYWGIYIIVAKEGVRRPACPGIDHHTKHCWSCVITPTSTDMQKMHVRQEENLTEQRLSFCMTCEKQRKRLVYAIYDQCGVEQFN